MTTRCDACGEIVENPKEKDGRVECPYCGEVDSLRDEGSGDMFIDD